MYNGDTVVTPPPIIQNLVMFQAFDSTALLDKSGNGNHAKGTFDRGPGYFISPGTSINFKGENFIRFEGTSSINNAFATEFSVSFWIFVNNFGTLANDKCDIMAKGDGNYQSFKLTVDIGMHNLIFVSESEDEGPVTLVSNAKLLLNRWTHVTLLRSNNLLILYVNGNLDSVNKAQPGKQSAGKPLFVGRMPWQDAIGGGCNMNFYFDELKVWDKVIEEAYIEAESGLSLGGGIEPHAVELG